MYLSNIEIVGFKSFAQKTDFKFSPGLSALVGPNGCGKTNIVDAVRWVLGEKKASVLRSDVMENVIFNGTNNRKPMGMAEVTLVLQNNRGVLPSEYNEISITRRLYRSGESQYLMNKTQCRLKDILNLFMDTGLGSDSYSVIELKMVEAILSGRLDERRAMFEEAAGIKKYKLRRKESLRRLNQIQQDLDRVRDILEEVRKNVNSLSRQAAKTRRYNKLMDELKTLESKLLKQEYYLISLQYNEIHNEIIELEKNKNKAEIEMAGKSESAEQLKLQLKEAEYQYQAALEKEKTLKSKIAATNQLLAVSNEKLLSSDSNINRIKKEIDDAEINIDDLKKRKDEAEEKFSELTKEIEKISEEYAGKINVREESLKVVKDARVLVDESNENVINLQSELNSLSAAKKRSADKRSTLQAKLNQTEEEKIVTDNNIIELNSELEKELDTLPEYNENIEAKTHEFNSAVEKRTSLQSAMESQRNKLNDYKNKLSSQKASLGFLKGIVHSNETSKFLLNSTKWRADKETFLFGEKLGTDEKYRVAVESVLGEAANFIIVETTEEAEQAHNLLADAKKGKATLIDLSAIKADDLEIPSYDNEKIIGSIYDFIRTDDKLKTVLFALLGNTVIAENYSDAKFIIKDKSIDRVVTLNGEVITNYAALKGGSTSENEAVWVGKQERIDKINAEISELNKNISELETELAELKEEYSSIDTQSLQTEIKSLEREKNQKEQSVSKMKLKIESLEHKLALIVENSIRYSDELEELVSDDSSNDSRINELTDKLTVAKEELQIHKNVLEKSESGLREAEKEARESELNSVRMNSEQSNLGKSIRSMESRINELNSIITKKKNEINSIISGKDELTGKISDLSEELEDLDDKVNEAKNELDILNENKSEFNEKYEEANLLIRELRSKYDTLNKAYHQRDLDQKEKELFLKNISNRLIENYEINPKEIDIVQDDEFNIDTAKKEVSEIKEKLSNIGSINFMALEEYEEQSQRLDFYEKQLTDLEESEVTLKETIHQINTEAEKRFAETFTEIRTNFVNLFKKLFGDDGYADLKLGEGNPLEADIEIIAKPPFKKPHSIEMLSGGEKTLTAISLLFAIYLVKPSPFCILDEVDAPLDDANIGKYVNLIKDFSEKTQFLIVTHNKKTMEAADTLYGITMQENGVSKIVSVRFGDEDAA